MIGFIPLRDLLENTFIATVAPADDYHLVQKCLILQHGSHFEYVRWGIMII